jgi:hypothetical protein
MVSPQVELLVRVKRDGGADCGVRVLRAASGEEFTDVGLRLGAMNR